MTFGRYGLSAAVILMSVATGVLIATERIFVDQWSPTRSELFIADADGSNARKLVAGLELDYNASFSFDGEWVVFTSERHGSADIFRVRTNGMGLERLTDDPAFDDQAALSPDGNSLAFVSTRDTGSTDMYLLDLKTRQTRNLTNSPGGDYRPSWSPDGRRIAFSPIAARRFSDRRATGNRCRPRASMCRRRWPRAAQTVVATASFAGSPKWSPDGARVVFYELAVADTFRARGLAAQATVESRIVSVDVATGARVEHASGPGLKLSPQFLDSKRIGYLAKSGASAALTFSSGEKGSERRHWQSGLVARWPPGRVSQRTDRDDSSGPQAWRLAAWPRPAIRPPLRERVSGRVARRATDCRQRANRPGEAGRSDLPGRLEYRWHEPPAHLPRGRVPDVAAVVPRRTVDCVRGRLVLCCPRDRACSDHDCEARRLRRSHPDHGAGQFRVSELVA